MMQNSRGAARADDAPWPPLAHRRRALAEQETTPAPSADGLTPAERAAVAAAAADARAPSTRRTYAGQWNRFAAWCAARGERSLPAAPALVAAYLTARAETARVSTVRVAQAAISAGHRARGAADPTAAPGVRAAVAGIARQHAARADAAPRQAAPLTIENAAALMALARQPRLTGRGAESGRVARRRGLEDSAIVSLAFCAGLRRAEIAALVWRDVSPADRPGRLKVRVRASKTNLAAGREDHRLLVGSFAAAVAALRAAADPAPEDRVVPLSPVQINRRIQRLARLAGIEGVSSHSGRRGLAAELVRRGASTTAVQQAGGWLSAGMVARYASSVAVEDGAVARYLDDGGDGGGDGGREAPVAGASDANMLRAGPDYAAGATTAPRRAGSSQPG